MNVRVLVYQLRCDDSFVPVHMYEWNDVLVRRDGLGTVDIKLVTKENNR